MTTTFPLLISDNRKVSVRCLPAVASYPIPDSYLHRYHQSGGLVLDMPHAIRYIEQVEERDGRMWLRGETGPWYSVTLDVWAAIQPRPAVEVAA